LKMVSPASVRPWNIDKNYLLSIFGAYSFII